MNNIFETTTSTEGCVLEVDEYFGQKTKEFVSFGSNPYDNRVATLTYKEEGEQDEWHYSPKSQPYFVAQDIVKTGMSAPFLSSSPLLENGDVSNNKALKFYQEVEAEVRAIGHYKVAIAVSSSYDYETKSYSYTPYFVRSKKDSISLLVATLAVEQDYKDLLQSPEVVEFVASFKTQHEADLAQVEVEKQELLVYKRELVQANNLLNGATFVCIENGFIEMLATNGVTFYIYASGDYNNHWLVIGGNEV